MLSKILKISGIYVSIYNMHTMKHGRIFIENILLKLLVRVKG